MSKKIKVLHVIGRRPQGGIGTFLLNMHSNLDISKVHFDYLINSKSETGAFDEKVRNLGGNIYVLPELTYRNTFIYLKELNRFYKEHQNYDIVHVHSVNIGLFNYLLAKRYGIKHRIAHSHSIKYSDSKLKSIRNYILQIPLKKLANVYFACSNEAALFLFGKKQVLSENVYMAKNAINARKFNYNMNIREKVRKDFGVDNEFIIGHVGAFLPVKNHEYILEIINELKEKDANIQLWLVGTGELESYIKDKVRELELEKFVKFMGARDDVHELMQAFDVFILPSKFEGLPLVGIEAQAAGLPCIFSDKVTTEVKLTDNVVFKSVQNLPGVWADEILKYQDHQRQETYNEILSNGYEVGTVAKKLQDYYLNLLNN